MWNDASSSGALVPPPAPPWDPRAQAAVAPVESNAPRVAQPRHEQIAHAEAASAEAAYDFTDEQRQLLENVRFASAPTNMQTPLAEAAPKTNWIETWDGYTFEHEVLARGYYFNDQRIEFTGLEATLGAEGVLAGAVRVASGDWEYGVTGEFFLNQPFDRNRLTDTPERKSYQNNFNVETFQISQLALTARWGDLFFSLGKMVTPFGRVHYPIYTNSFVDSPFIRSEAILFRETAFLLQWDPWNFVFTAALVNGTRDLDNNSSKGLIARAAYEIDWLVLGSSIKWQDGIGSEQHKLYNNHIGVDAMARWRNWRLSGEAIYDQYGFHRPDLALDDIDWGRGVYYREQNLERKKPIEGLGWYLNLDYEFGRFLYSMNYGEYYPGKIGDPRQDAVNRRGLFKLVFHITEHLDFYGVFLSESDLPNAHGSQTRPGKALLTGFQFSI